MFGGLGVVSGLKLQLSQLTQRRGRFGIELQNFFQRRRASSVRLSSDAIIAVCNRFCSSILSLGSGKFDAGAGCVGLDFASIPRNFCTVASEGW